MLYSIRLLFLFLFISIPCFAKEFKINRCQLPDGKVILTDSWCKANEKILNKSTDLPKKTNKKNKLKRTYSEKSVNKNNYIAVRNPVKSQRQNLRKKSSLDMSKGNPSEGQFIGLMVKVNHPESWEVNQKRIEDKMLHFDFRTGNEILMNLDFVSLPKGKKFSRDELVVLLQSVSRWMSNNPDNNIQDWVTNMSFNDGVGVYANFEVSRKGFQYNTKGYIYRFGFLIQFNILSHSLENALFDQALDVLYHGIVVR